MTGCDIAVIGGGAAGLMAAICAKDTNGGIRVAVFERYERVGRKLLATGNGRCNLTNVRAVDGGYHGDATFAEAILRACPPERVLRRFSALGLRAVEESDGRVYPLCGQASAVLDALRFGCDERGVDTVCGFDIVSVERRGASFRLHARDGRICEARRVILCAGSPAAPQLGGTDAGLRILHSLGHATEPARPALSQLLTNPDDAKPFKGQRFEGGVDLCVDDRVVRCETGEVLFTDYGLSGIAAMQLARDAGAALARKQRVIACLRLLPDDVSSLEAALQARASRFPGREAAEYLTGLVSKRIGQHLMKKAGIQPLSRPCRDITANEIRLLARLLTHWEIVVTGVRGFDGAQVAAGGALCSGFSGNLQSRTVPGLYAAGEVLNVDGDCGGYNLQWAWATGILAGENAGKSLGGGRA